MPDYDISYHDPELWLRLAPRLHAHLAEKSDHLATHRAASYDEYRERLGYIAGLRWVIAEAAELTKIETRKED